MFAKSEITKLIVSDCKQQHCDLPVTSPDKKFSWILNDDAVMRTMRDRYKLASCHILS